jgi:hypothetical protein
MDDDLDKDNTFHAEDPKEAVGLLWSLRLMSFDAIGEITLTTKGKDSDPWYAHENVSPTTFLSTVGEHQID